MRNSLRSLIATSFLLAACSGSGSSKTGSKPAVSAKEARSSPASQQAKPVVPVKEPKEEAQAAKAQATTARSDQHVVFSMINNRALAHLVRDGGFALAAGLPGIAKYLNFNRPWRTWTLRQTVEGTRCAVARKSVSWLSVPLSGKEVQASILSLRVASAVSQTVRISINGKKLERSALAEGWQQLKLEVPKAVLVAGENRIEFKWAKKGRMGTVRRAFGALDWLVFGAATPAENTVFSPARSGGLYLPKDGGLAYYVRPYAGSSLLLRTNNANACVVTLGLEGDKGKPTTVALTRLASDGEQQVALSGIADRVARLSLTASGASCKGLVLTEAAIVRPGPEPKVERRKRPKNVLFWMVDNWRADHFRAYNPKSRVETPVMSQLARTGAVFEAYIVGSESRVSHASIWTGLFPKQHRFISSKAKLPSAFVTIAEALRKAKMVTAAWTANGNVSKFWGFGEGWSVYRNTLHKGGGLTAERLANHAISFIEKRGQQPFYLYIGTIDPHVSWKGRQPWLRRYHPEPYRGPFTKRVAGPIWDKLAARPKSVSAANRKRVLAIYDSTISYNDQQLGRVLATLKKQGLRDDTMIVITADHGEEFWEYGSIGHGASMRESVVRVPLIIHYPPLFGQGVFVHEGAEVTALMASILDALAVPIPEQVQASSLLPLAQGVGRGYPRAMLASQYELAHAMRIAEWKIWVGGKGQPRLYDMRVERQPERRSLAAEHPRAVRMLTDALSTFLVYQQRWRQGRWGVANNHRAALASDLLGTTPPAPIRPR